MMGELKHFRFWCYKVLPLVYDDSLSYYEVLCKVVDYINKLIDQDKEFAENIEGIKSDISTIQKWIEDFDASAVSDVVEQALDIVVENIYAIYKFRNIVCIGDSYGTSNGGGTTISDTFPNVLKSYLGIGTDYFHASFANGAGFGNGAFNTLLSNLANSMSDKDSVTDVYFFGGWNDEANRITESEFITGVSNCETTIANNFPNAKKHVVFWSNRRGEWSEDLWTTRNWYRELNARGWATHLNISYILINPSLYVSDGAHPNQYGVNALARASVEMILNGNADIHYRTIIPLSDLTAEDDVTTNASTTNGYLILTSQNDTTEVCLNVPTNNLVFKFQSGGADAPKSVTYNGTEIKVASFPNKTISGATTNCGITLPCWAHYADDTGETVAIRIVFRTDGVYLKLPYLTKASYAPVTVSVKAFIIPSGFQNVDSNMV